MDVYVRTRTCVSVKGPSFSWDLLLSVKDNSFISLSVQLSPLYEHAIISSVYKWEKIEPIMHFWAPTPALAQPGGFLGEHRLWTLGRAGFHSDLWAWLAAPLDYSSVKLNQVRSSPYANGWESWVGCRLGELLSESTPDSGFSKWPCRSEISWSNISFCRYKGWLLKHKTKEGREERKKKNQVFLWL